MAREILTSYLGFYGGDKLVVISPDIYPPLIELLQKDKFILNMFDAVKQELDQQLQTHHTQHRKAK